MTTRLSTHPSEPLEALDAAAKVAHGRLMWTSQVNGHGRFWETLTAAERGGWREYVRDITDALPASFGGGPRALSDDQRDQAEADIDLLDPLHTVDYDDETQTTGECTDDCPGCSADRLRRLLGLEVHDGSADRATPGAPVVDGPGPSVTAEQGAPAITAGAAGQTSALAAAPHTVHDPLAAVRPEVTAGPPADWDCGGIPLRVRDRWIAVVMEFLLNAGYRIVAPNGRDVTRP